MKKQQQGQPLPPIEPGFSLPFYYSSLANIEVMYLIDPKLTLPYLKDTGLEPALFNGKALVGYNFQQYTGQFPGFTSVVQEIELNIVSFPTKQATEVAQVDAKQYMRGEEQSKLIGNHRVSVACDNDNAIQAGIKLFGEPKFKTSFDFSMLSQNDQTVKTWSFTCNDPINSSDKSKAIMTCNVDTQHLTGELGMISPITEYGQNSGKLIGCRWNILMPNQIFFMTAAEAKKRVKLTLGSTDHSMRVALSNLIGNTPAFAVRSVLSLPAASQTRAYFV